ncbi:hypothetical protein [Glutamicibacter sp. NPDC087344]|uniref:hypothetical protein n=1 Tax=Glutamicibacter sp. NPDC087344 TaxID=3363994 RepID=UPI0037F203AB
MNLQELVQTHTEGRSKRAIAENSRGKLSASQLSLLATKPVAAFPKPETIRAIARAFRIPPLTIVLATCETLGLADDNSITEEITFWQGHAQHYKSQIENYRRQNEDLRRHFRNLTPIARERPYLLAGTGHNKDHLDAIDNEQPNPVGVGASKRSAE